MKHIPLGVAIVLSLILMQIVSQRAGDKILWSSADEGTISFTQDPCMEIQARLQDRTPLPPAARMLLQSCVQTRIFEFSAQKLAQILPSLADIEYQQRRVQLSASQLAIAQYPVLEERVQKLCSERRFDRSICSSLPLKKAKKALDELIVMDLMGEDERLQLRALQLACTLGERGTAIAKRVGKKSFALMIQSCTLERTEAIAMLRSMLQTENPFLPIVALELRRHNATQARKELAQLQTQDDLSRVMIDFALQGIPR